MLAPSSMYAILLADNQLPRPLINFKFRLSILFHLDCSNKFPMAFLCEHASNYQVRRVGERFSFYFHTRQFRHARQADLNFRWRHIIPTKSAFRPSIFVPVLILCECPTAKQPDFVASYRNAKSQLTIVCQKLLLDCPC